MSSSALSIAKTGMDAQQRRISNIANNLANISTNGYKNIRLVLEDLGYQVDRQPGADSAQDQQLPTGLIQGTGVRVAATQTNHSQGSISQTGNSLDMAIQGQGFFQISMPDGSTAYTRNGQFELSSDGKIVNSQGYPLTPEITVPANVTSFTIGIDGIITVQTAGNTTPTTLGQIQLATFLNPAGLQQIGGTFYVETAASGTATISNPGTDGAGQLNQGQMEGSNVNAVASLVEMVEAQRAYEMNSKGISATDSMWRTITQAT